MSERTIITEKLIKTFVSEELSTVQAVNARDALKQFEQAFDRVVTRVNKLGYDYTRDTFMEFLQTLEK